MLSLLEERNVKLWVVMVETNNLKKALKPAEVERYRLLIQTLLRISPTSKILACELFKRKDLDDRYVEESNEALRSLVKEMNGNLGWKTYWLDAPTEVTKEHLADHVHLDEEGYRIWDYALYPLIGELLGNM
jgi:lysophospholipase L1-like esterase